MHIRQAGRHIIAIVIEDGNVELPGYITRQALEVIERHGEKEYRVDIGFPLQLPLELPAPKRGDQQARRLADGAIRDCFAGRVGIIRQRARARKRAKQVAKRFEDVALPFAPGSAPNATTGFRLPDLDRASQ